MKTFRFICFRVARRSPFTAINRVLNPNWRPKSTNIGESVLHASGKEPSCFRLCDGAFFVLVLTLFSAAPAQSATFALGTTALLQGPTAGTNSVVLAASPATAAWTASTNASWLHLTPAKQSGSGSTNVIFKYDENGDGTDDASDGRYQLRSLGQPFGVGSRLAGSRQRLRQRWRAPLHLLVGWVQPHGGNQYCRFD
jgi:hypothetical protein